MLSFLAETLRNGSRRRIAIDGFTVRLSSRRPPIGVRLSFASSAQSSGHWRSEFPRTARASCERAPVLPPCPSLDPFRCLRPAAPASVRPTTPVSYRWSLKDRLASCSRFQLAVPLSAIDCTNFFDGAVFANRRYRRSSRTAESLRVRSGLDLCNRTPQQR
jgi:hypothetical protein